MLSPQQVTELKDEIDHCTKPLIFFDGDNDGLTSFLQLYRYKGDGKGVILKSKPNLTLEHVRRVEEYGPDKIFVFDVALVDQEFIDAVKVPIYWFDHHGPYDRTGGHLKYINSLLWDSTTSPCVMIYQICQKDLWIAALGAIADHQIPYFWKEFVTTYPHLAEDRVYNGPFDVRFNTPLCILIKVFSFNLKGSTTDAMKSIKIMSRITGPDEILNQETAQGRFLFRKYQALNKEYEFLRKKALKAYSKEDPFFIFKYTENQTSFTKDLADDLMYHHQDKVIVLAREKEGHYVMSMRTSESGPVIKDSVERALVGLEGSGGGHAHACGCKIPQEHFETFISRLREELKMPKKTSKG